MQRHTSGKEINKQVKSKKKGCICKRKCKENKIQTTKLDTQEEEEEGERKKERAKERERRKGNKETERKKEINEKYVEVKNVQYRRKEKDEVQRNTM